MYCNNRAQIGALGGPAPVPLAHKSLIFCSQRKYLRLAIRSRSRQVTFGDTSQLIDSRPFKVHGIKFARVKLAV